MTTTDPIADMLTRLRNVSSAYYGSIGMPYSKMKAAITNILQTEGYIKDYQVEKARVSKASVLSSKYDTRREHAISGMKRASKPGLRVYAKSSKLPKVMDGPGVVIVSSSSGLLTDRETIDKGVDGEVVAYIW